MEPDEIWIPDNPLGMIALFSTYVDTTNDCVESYLRWESTRPRRLRRKEDYDPTFNSLRIIFGLDIFEQAIIAQLNPLVPPTNVRMDLEPAEITRGQEHLQAIIRGHELLRGVLIMAGVDYRESVEAAIPQGILHEAPNRGRHPLYYPRVQRPAAVAAWRRLIQ
jgi:hypothetical protein